MTDINFDVVFESIENSKKISRKKMYNSKYKLDQEYYCGQIGGLQMAKQILEKLKQ
jgi:hypothetical protein